MRERERDHEETSSSALGQIRVPCGRSFVSSSNGLLCTALSRQAIQRVLAESSSPTGLSPVPSDRAIASTRVRQKPGRNRADADSSGNDGGDVAPHTAGYAGRASLCDPRDATAVPVAQNPTRNPPVQTTSSTAATEESPAPHPNNPRVTGQGSTRQRAQPVRPATEAPEPNCPEQAVQGPPAAACGVPCTAHPEQPRNARSCR